MGNAQFKLFQKGKNMEDENVLLFDGDDEAYRAWLVAHPGGYVLNTRRGIDPGYMVLH